jgi:hypothetical protein
MVLSTPVKHGTSTLNKFTTNHKYREKEMWSMGAEMKKFFVGPMPVDKFLNTFFPKNLLDPSSSRCKRFVAGSFKDTISARSETDAYDPFVGSSIFM